jgi:hypothetical protein
MLGEVAIGVSAGSIDLPKTSYAIPVGGFVIAVLIASVSDRPGTRERSRRGTENPATSAGAGHERVHVLKGTQKTRKPWNGVPPCRWTPG